MCRIKTTIAILWLALSAGLLTGCSHQSQIPNTNERPAVFYIASTNVLSAVDEQGQKGYRALLTPEDSAAIGGEINWVAEHMFDSAFSLTAPFYHQFTFEAVSLPKEQFDSVYTLVAVEMCAVFDDYMKRIGDQPYILAGFSQGGMLVLDLLKHMTDAQYEQMIAAYAIGYRLTEADLQHPHIRAAQSDSDRGVVISFNSTLSQEAIWPFVAGDAAACINPVNWRTDTVSAVFTHEGIRNRIYVDPETQVLLVESEHPDAYRQWMDKAGILAEAGVSHDCLHHWDLLFYSRHLRDNALLRARIENNVKSN